MTDPERVNRLIAAFRVFDTDNTGTVPTIVLQTVLTTYGAIFTKDEIAEFVNDADESGVVHYVSFVKTVVFA